MNNPQKDISLSPFGIALIYFIVAVVWIAFTDQILNFFVDNPQRLSRFQTYKGWGYVLFTSVGLYYLIKKYTSQLVSKEEKLASFVKKLKSSKEKYRHFFHKNPQPMWIYSPETLEFIEVNKAAVEHYGYLAEEFLSMTLKDLHLPEDVTALKEDVANHRGITSYNEEWRHLKKDGTEITVTISAADVEYEKATYRLVLVNDITKQKRIQEKIIQSAIEGEDRERKRIAHELHDGLGQYLVAANMNFVSLHKAIKKLPQKRQEQFNTGRSLLKSALSETRNIAHNLMPQAISDYGLMVALENLISNLEKSTDITFSFNHNCSEFSIKKRASINIYRILQEITSNAVRHAHCSKVSIQLNINENTFTIFVEDDGVGTQLNQAQENKGLGLRSIKTRVNNLKGQLDIQSQPGEGMTTTITIPNIKTLMTNNDH